MVAPQNRRVLVVDDDSEVLDGFEAGLSILVKNCKVYEASDGQEALRVCERENPKVVVLDMMLPGGIAGFEVLERLKRVTGEKPYVLCVTGDSNPAHKERAIGLGADEYLAKPIDMQTIANTVKIYLDR